MKKVILLCGLSLCLSAGELQDAVKALKIGHYKEALVKFELLAMDGNQIAQQNLGVMYNQGLGVKKDEMKAAYWFNVATDEVSDFRRLALN